MKKTFIGHVLFFSGNQWHKAPDGFRSGLYLIFLPLLVALPFSVFFSCADMVPTKEVRVIDSLNGMAYAYRYRDLDSSHKYALCAYRQSRLYKSGKAEAANNLGFCAFMRMDFERASKYYKQVYRMTTNELELLIADIGLMKIYQRTAMNKEFYDYRNSALRRMKRIREESDLFVDRHETIRLHYAFSEFFVVSTIYYHYLRQWQKARASLDNIPEEKSLADTTQMLYYHYIKGAAFLVEGDSLEDRKLSSFDELALTWKLAVQSGQVYFEGNSIQGIADMMTSSDEFSFFLARRMHVLERFGLPLDTLLPFRLAQRALETFRQYNDLYQIAGVYVTMGKYLNAHGCYAEALDTLSRALDCVNSHHALYYHRLADAEDKLLLFSEEDTLHSGVSWIEREKVKTIPEWISRIREQLSVSYAGLGMKRASDYNRNVYLDLLNYTRQDKELESRYLSLEADAKQVRILLFVVVISMVLIVILWWFLNRRSSMKNQIDVKRLQLVLSLCRDITSSIPMNLPLVQDGVDRLFGKGRVTLTVQEDGKAVWNSSYHCGRDEKALMRVLEPYIEWASDNERALETLSDERIRLEKLRYVYERHIAENKRQNIVKRACMSIVNGIHPYIDRILNEVHKLTEKGYIKDETIKREKYQYIDELVSKINEYNDILALWIKMRQGTLSLNIEIFSLNDLFDLLGKGRRTFDMRKLKLEVVPTDALVKADRALTLFMINTLADNARKYTPSGGVVKIYAVKSKDYVEISVEDNGMGISAEDVNRIIGEKVYDAYAIGMKETADPEGLKRSKGGGFGLMNCKGIIEKYKKIGGLFRVCSFNVDSKIGKGSRFYFRLPLGMRKSSLLPFYLFFIIGINSCSYEAIPSNMVEKNDSVVVVSDSSYDKFLDVASDYANAAYFANVDEQYTIALQYIDSAIMSLNEHYRRYADPMRIKRYLRLMDKEIPAEILWWNEHFDSDYHVIMDIRNEAAVAFLALKRLEEYNYNNWAFTSLYKLQGEDRTLEVYCRQLERSNTNKTVGIILCIMLLVILLIGYYFLYLRKRLQSRLDLEQILEINQKIFSISSHPQENVEALQCEENILKEIPKDIINQSFINVNELLTVQDMGIAVYNEGARKLEYVSNANERMPEIVKQCFEQAKDFSIQHSRAVPLIVEQQGKSQCVGVLYIEQKEGVERETDLLLLELVARYVAIVVFNVIIKLAAKFRDIDSAHEEARRASWEDSSLHVQNMVLDNCLSTIKHETVYYPNRIKQIVGKLNSSQISENEEREDVETIVELIEYYKGIFTILSSCASRQLEGVIFRRSIISVGELFNAADKYFQKKIKGIGSISIELMLETVMENVIGDKNLLCFLLEVLIDEALMFKESGALRLQAVKDGDYIRFLFTDTRRNKSKEELRQLFYPELAHMIAEEKGVLHGTEYLICKQIIREHDEFSARRGCRIDAEQAEEGFTVYFTIPCK